MSMKSWLHVRNIVTALFTLALVLTISCGGATAEPTATPTAESQSVPTTAPVATTEPIATIDVPTPGVMASTESKPWESFASEAKSGGVLRNAEPVLPDHWDLHQSCCNPGPGASRDLFNNLVLYDPTDQKTIVGDLASSWEWAEDGLSVTFRIWDDANWSDGSR